MAKVVGHHSDGSKCYTVGCRLAHVSSSSAALAQGDVNGFLNASLAENAQKTVIAPPDFLHRGKLTLPNNYVTNGFNTSTTEKLSIVESPVSDRDHNYHLDIKPGGWVTLDVNETGIYDPDYGLQGERDQIFIGNEDGKLNVQYITDPEDLSYVAEEMDDDEREQAETKIRDYLKKNYNATADFTSSDAWDDVTVIYNSSEPTHNYQELKDGGVSITTSNLMAALESDKSYLNVRGNGPMAVYEAMNELGINH